MPASATADGLGGAAAAVRSGTGWRLGALWQCRNEKLEGGDLAAQGGEGSGGGVVGGRRGGGEDCWEGRREGQGIVGLARRVGGLRRI